MRASRKKNRAAPTDTTQTAHPPKGSRRSSSVSSALFAAEGSKSDRTRQRIIAAAAKVVARDGYPKTSIAKITQEADLASGSFYYYYRNREELLNELLPVLGKEMVQFILDRVRHMEWGLEREMAGFRAYFEFLEQSPEFFRVFTEAQVYVPEAYKEHLQWILNNYVHGLKKQVRFGGLKVAPSDLMPLAYALTGIRNYATQMLYGSRAEGKATADDMFRIYRQFLSGIFVSG